MERVEGEGSGYEMDVEMALEEFKLKGMKKLDFS